MSVELLTLIFFGLLIVLITTGLPIAFCLAGEALIFILWQLDPASLYLIATASLSNWTNFVLISIPLFLLMAYFLEISDIAEDLYDMMYKWMGGLRGGLAIGTVVICAVFGAMAGISGVATITMGVIALPSMRKRNYDKLMAIGCIAAGGPLGILIPPSIIMIIYASLTDTSIGKLFMGGVFSGIAMTLIYIFYIAIRCWIQPHLGPPLPNTERATWDEKLKSLKAVAIPMILVFSVLGVIYTGIATPTEASAIGAFGALLCSVARRRLTWSLTLNALMRTLQLTCMIMWIILGAKLFYHVYYAIGATSLINSFMQGLELNRWLMIMIMQLILVVLGCFIDPTGIMVITTPVFIPLVEAMGFDPIWFGILFTINMEIGYITPPFGINLFYLKGIVPPDITMGDIYESIMPFVILGIVGLVLVMVFPQLATWLPSTMIK